MSQPRVPSPVFSRDIRSAIFSTSSSATESTASTTEIAMQRSPAEPKPGVDGGVGHEVEVGVGQHEHVVLRAAERLHPLAVGGRRSRRCTARSASSRRTRSRRRRGACSSASTASLSPCTTLSTPSGRPASFMSFASQMAAVGSFSRRLQHDRVAGRDRDREEPHRHHRREVERADDADDAERLAESCRRRRRSRRSRENSPLV